PTPASLPQGPMPAASLVSEGVVAEILAYNSLSTVEHWSFLVAWLKARQHVENLSAGSGVGELDVLLAHDDAIQLLPIFFGSLYSLPSEEFKLLIEPYLLLFSEETQASLEFHFKSASKEVQKWGMGRHHVAQSTILSRTSIKSLEAALRTAVTLPPANLIKMKLLFRASTAEFDSLKFHEACDGKSNTLTAIKTVGGKVVGGYVDAPWNSHGISAKEACLFADIEANRKVWITASIKQDGLLEGMFGHQEYGPTFGTGRDLFVTARQVQSCLQSYGAGMTSGEFLGGVVCEID
ncbi:hypothetical protein HDU98_009127, partial [Podochytrium sp. JEL0797]